MSSQRQHYVPQFYLRYFAFSPKKRSQIYVHDLRQNNRIFVAAIKNVAQEHGFYETSSGMSIEPYLAQLEGKVAHVWKKLSKGDLNLLTEEDRLSIVLFVCTMMVRTLALKETLQDLVSAVRQRLNLDDETEIAPILMQQLDISDDAINHSMNNMIAQSVQWVPLLLQMHWMLGHPPAGRFFSTSDNPVVRFNSVNPESIGLMSPGVELHLPVSSKLVLLMVDAAPDLRTRLPHHFAYNLDNLLHLTHLLVLESSKFLFSQDGKIEFDLGMLRGQPRIIAT